MLPIRYEQAAPNVVDALHQAILFFPRGLPDNQDARNMEPTLVGRFWEDLAAWNDLAYLPSLGNWPFIDLASSIEPELILDEQLLATFNEVAVFDDYRNAKLMLKANLRLEVLRTGRKLMHLPNPYRHLVLFFDHGGDYWGGKDGFIELAIGGIRRPSRDQVFPNRSRGNRLIENLSVFDDLINYLSRKKIGYVSGATRYRMHFNFEVDGTRFSFLADFYNWTCNVTIDLWSLEIHYAEVLDRIVAQIIGLIEGRNRFHIIEAGKQPIAITIEQATT